MECGPAIESGFAGRYRGEVAVPGHRVRVLSPRIFWVVDLLAGSRAAQPNIAGRRAHPVASGCGIAQSGRGNLVLSDRG